MGTFLALEAIHTTDLRAFLDTNEARQLEHRLWAWCCPTPYCLERHKDVEQATSSLESALNDKSENHSASVKTGGQDREWQAVMDLSCLAVSRLSEVQMLLVERKKICPRQTPDIFI